MSCGAPFAGGLRPAYSVDMATFDDDIARHLEASAASGELRAAPSWGKPLAETTGYEQTPEALRLPFKILKNAGFVPPEVELFRQMGALRTELAQAAGDTARERALGQRLSDLQQRLALRLEHLRHSGTL